MKKKQRRPNNNQYFNKRRVIAMALLLIFVMFVPAIIYNAYVSRYTTEHPETRPIEPKFTLEGELAFISENDTLKIIAIEVADDEASIEQGLMWRRSMPDNVGMLFIFPDEDYRNFWMKNTHIPLDIIYVGSNMEIVDIAVNTIPFSEMLIPSERPAQYVVEVNAGTTALHNIKVGDRINFELFQ